MGIEPTSEAWEASILPLYDARSFRYGLIIHNEMPASTDSWLPFFQYPPSKHFYALGFSVSARRLSALISLSTSPLARMQSPANLSVILRT
jgi:hypothetical protein